jgi:hypothetical protein
MAPDNLFETWPRLMKLILVAVSLAFSGAVFIAADWL